MVSLPLKGIRGQREGEDVHVLARGIQRDDTSSTDERNLIPAKVPGQGLRSGKLRAFTGVSEKQISRENISRRRVTQDGRKGGRRTQARHFSPQAHNKKDKTFA